jgi:hypothetical protein
MNTWISVKDALPDCMLSKDGSMLISEPVLIATNNEWRNNRTIAIATHEGVRVESMEWLDDECCRIENVTHWMLLPKHPAQG